MGSTGKFRWLPRLLALALAGHGVSAQALVFAVNEGVTYRVPLNEIRARYEAIAQDLSKLLHQSVSIEPVGDYRSLRAGLADKRWELALVHPAHVSIQAIKQSQYRLVAVTKGFTGYKASFMVRGDSALKAVPELKGLRVGAPDEDSITAVMMRATLRDAGLDASQMPITYTRYQDAVPFFLENKLTHVGVTGSAAVVKDWVAKGGRVIAASTPVPIKHVIASPAITPEQFEKIQAYLTGLDSSDEGKKKLEPTKWKGFERYDQDAMLKLGAWLGL